MAKKLNLSIDQGATFSTEIVVIDDDTNEPVDLTSYTGNSQIRKTYSASTSYPFTVDMSANGVVTLQMSANTTANIAGGRYMWDLSVAYSNTVSRLVEGIVVVNPRVTR